MHRQIFRLLRNIVVDVNDDIGTLDGMGHE